MEIDIEKVAELARLSLKPDEKSHLSKDLEKILAYVKKLASLTTGDIEPTSHVLNIENVFRKDEVKPQPAVAHNVLQHAPQVEGEFFKVPKVIEGS